MTIRVTLFGMALLMAASLSAQCPSGPDPLGLGRPSEWTITYQYLFPDQSIGVLYRHVCRDWMEVEVINGTTYVYDTVDDLMWWEWSWIGWEGCDAEYWPDSVQWWLPPEKRVWPRRRVA